jgi:ABC-type Mn2+/Zn2+ transport system ATPase subunit
LIIGKTFVDKNKVYFSSPFERLVQELKTQNFPNYSIDKLLTLIKRFYSYIYIPVESKVSDTLKLETFEMQQLMNKDILETIDSVLTSKEFTNPETNRKTNAVSYINKALNSFMEEVNKDVKLIDEKYSFKVDTGFKKNLTTSDLRTKILEAYFSIRTLKKETKEIYELSSGEQRIALIDIASAFLSNSGEKDGFLILAIDEPEASMHISKCYRQFKRLENITNQSNLQVMMTTHWYGSLPTIQKGNLHHISQGEKPVITTFDFLNYLEERRTFPDDIEMKSFFELITTIISSIKNEKTNWIICEGSDDKQYLGHFLNNEIENFNILPVGGIGNVIKLYEYLFAPFSENKEKNLLKEGKILCIIDSDLEQKTIKVPSSVDNSLKICRLQLDSENKFQFKNLKNTGLYIQTVMEDCLNNEAFKQALTKTIEENCTSEIKELFEQFEYNENCINSRIKGEENLLKPLNVNVISKKQDLYDSFKSNSFKYALSKNYIEVSNNNDFDKPTFINEIINFFNNK